MAGGKRNTKVFDFDPNKSDSNDSDFDVKETRSPRKKSRKVSKKKKPKKKRAYGSDEDEDESLDESSEDLSIDESDEESDEPVHTSKAGRPMRSNVVKKQPSYEEKDTEEEGSPERTESSMEPAPKKGAAGRPGRAAPPIIVDDDEDKGSAEPRESMIVKLKVGQGNLPSDKPPTKGRRGSRKPTPKSRAASIQRSRHTSTEPLLEGLQPVTRKRTRGSRSTETPEGMLFQPVLDRVSANQWDSCRLFQPPSTRSRDERSYWSDYQGGNPRNQFI